MCGTDNLCHLRPFSFWVVCEERLCTAQSVVLLVLPQVPSVWLDGIVRVLLDAPACTREPLLPSLPSPHSLPDLTARAWQRAESAGALGAAVSTGSAAAASTALGLQALPASELMRVAWAVVQLSASATRGGVGSADAAGGGADQAAGGVTRKWAQALFSATQTRMREFRWGWTLRVCACERS